MKHSSRSKWPLIFKVIVLSLLLLFTLFAHHTRAFAEGATISTDKTDYEPEETVTYTGSGFQPAEIVDILAAGSTNGSTIIRQATADENGNFTGSFELSRTFEANYQLTAAGSSSGLIAQASFYDRLENFVFVAPSPLSPPVYLKPSATQVYKVLATNQAGNGVNNAPIVWSAQGGSIGSITPSDSKTDNNGNSTATYTAGSTEGTFVVSAVATGGGNGGVDLPASPTETVVIDGTAPVITASAKTADNQPYTAGTWTKQNVTVTFTCTDVINQGVQSGVQSFTAPVTVSTEGNNQSVPGTCTDKAGNSASTTFSGIKIDKTAPTLSFGAASPAANANGWNNTNVSFTYTTADNLSGVASSIPTSPLLLSTEGTAVTGTVTVTDNAGNSATFTSSAVKIDKTPPAITANATIGSPATTYTSGTWTNKDVTVSFTCTDTNGSGVQSFTAPVTVSTEGNNQSVPGTCTDKAGNSASTTFSGIKIDKTAPVITAHAAVGNDPYTSGTWTNKDVTITFACTDTNGSGVQSSSDPSTFNSEEADQSATGSCLDVAGNSASTTFEHIDIDKTAPVITAHAAVGNDPYISDSWTNQDVKVSFTCSDTLSGVQSVNGPSTFSSEGKDQSATGTCADKAGNSASTSFNHIDIDKTAPVITAHAAVGNDPYISDSWTNQDVKVSFTCSDTLSGVQTFSDPSTFSAEGANQSATGSCADKAGNSASTSFGPIKIDKTPPTLTFDTASPAPNANGWNNGNVSFVYTTVDSLSGVNTSNPASPLLVTVEGNAATGAVTVTDNAGNSATYISPAVKIDKTPPTLTFDIASPPANGNGWNNSDVSFAYTTADNLSGIDPNGPTSPLGVTAEGNGVTANVTITDLAGNSATFTSPAVNIDKTKPTLTFGTANPAANGAGWNKSDVTFAYTTADNLSGVDPNSPAGPLAVMAEGTGVTANVTITDNAGNSATFTSPAVNIDKTPPTNIIGKADRDPDHNGWFNKAVTISFTGADPLSGIASCTSGAYSAPDSAAASQPGSCTDMAGNTASGTFAFKYDGTGPTAALAVTAGTVGANGWYTSDVTISTSGIDTVSGSVTCTADQQQTAETAGQAFNGSCTNDAGLTTAAALLTVKLDKTGPTAKLAAFGKPGDNGWFTDDVLISTTGSDSISETVVCTPAQHQTKDDAGAVFNGSCTNNAGLKTDAAPLTVKLDKTPPTALLTATGTTGANGWFTDNVTVGTTGDDNVSGPVTCTNPQSQTAETGGTTFSGSCINKAGLKADAAPVTVKLDKTGPSAVLAVTAGTPGANEWYVSDVTVSTTGSDAISGVAICTNPQSQTAETAGQAFNGSCTNNAGLTTNTASVTIKLDKTAPTNIIGKADRDPDHNGWFNKAVTINFTGADPLSGIASCTSGAYSAPDSAAASQPGSCTDMAGNTTAGTFAFKYDGTGPTAALAVTAGTVGANGWYTSDVTISTSGIDTVSGPVTCTADKQQTVETAGTTFNGSCTNDAGLTTDATALKVKLDKSGPAAALAVTTGTLGTNGWYITNVTVSTTGSDSISEPTKCTDPQQQTTETAGQAFNGSCTNAAGLTTNAAPISVKLDKTPPTVAFAAASPAANSNGWNNTDVSFSFTTSDSLSGVASSTPVNTLTVTAEGQGVSGTVTVTDNAGNVATMPSPLVNIDKTAPTVSANRAPAANANGWNNMNVTVKFNGTDTVSGIDTCTPDVTLTNEGPGQSAGPGACTDKAGNVSAPVTASGINIDKTPPTGTITSPASGAIFWINQSAAVNYACADALSGLVSCVGPVASGANIDTSKLGTYTFAVNATDKAGNTIVAASIQYTVAPYATSGMCNGEAGHTVLQPVNSDGTSVFKQGSTVPVKFRVCVNGISVGTPRVVNSFQQGKVTAGVVGPIDETVDSTTPDTAFRWDPTAQQWIFNVSTKSLKANTTYVYNITLNDGSIITFQFGLR